MAKLYHPDVNKEKDADDKFKRIHLAYEALKTETDRELYDAYYDNDPYSGEWKYKEEMYRDYEGDSAKNDSYQSNFKSRKERKFWENKEGFEDETFKDFANAFKGDHFSSASKVPDLIVS